MAVLVLSTGTASAFYDVSAVHPHAAAIAYVRDQGIVQGYADGRYGPDNIINRAEFTKIIMEATGKQTGGSRCFPDVREEWFARYVCAAKDLGVVSGYPHGYFEPQAPVNFVEAAKIVAVAFSLRVLPAEQSQAWYEPYVDALETDGAIPTDITSIAQPLTRGQMAEIVYRLHAGIRDLPSPTFEELTHKVGEGIGSVNEEPRVLHILGDPYARYTVVEHCTRLCLSGYQGLRDRVLANYSDVQWGHRYILLEAIYPNGPLLAQALECAAQYGNGAESFWAYSDAVPALHEKETLWNEDLKDIAESIGIERDLFGSGCLQYHNYREYAQKDSDAVQGYGVDGEPTIIVTDNETGEQATLFNRDIEKELKAFIERTKAGR